MWTFYAVNVFVIVVFVLCFRVFFVFGLFVFFHSYFILCCCCFCFMFSWVFVVVVVVVLLLFVEFLAAFSCREVFGKKLLLRS